MLGQRLWEGAECLSAHVQVGKDKKETEISGRFKARRAKSPLHGYRFRWVIGKASACTERERLGIFWLAPSDSVMVIHFYQPWSRGSSKRLSTRESNGVLQLR